jgi:hypothetical protein
MSLYENPTIAGVLGGLAGVSPVPINRDERIVVNYLKKGT